MALKPGIILAYWVVGMANRFQTWTQKTVSRIQALRVNPAQFKAVIQWLQSSQQQARLPFVVQALSLVLGTYFAADLTALLAGSFLPEATIAPLATSGMGGFGSTRANQPQIEEYSAISSRNLFNSRGLIPGEEAIPGSNDPGGAPVRTTLPLALIGTLILRNELKSIATIEDRTASLVLPLRIQDEIPGKIRVLTIEPRRVVFLNLGSSRREFVDLPDDSGTAPRITLGSPRMSPSASGGIEQSSPTNFTIDRSEIDRAMADLNAILTQARAVPNFENGVPAGYKLFQIVPGSIYEKLGLRNGDTITGLNGDTINDPGKAFETLSALKTMKHLELQLKRDGKVSNFSYDIRN